MYGSPLFFASDNHCSGSTDGKQEWNNQVFKILFTTTLAGIVVGELSHVATIKLGKNGFRWHEVALVCLINPAYAINNGFRFKHLKRN